MRTLMGETDIAKAVPKNEDKYTPILPLGAKQTAPWRGTMDHNKTKRARTKRTCPFQGQILPS